MLGEIDKKTDDKKEKGFSAENPTRKSLIPIDLVKQKQGVEGKGSEKVQPFLQLSYDSISACLSTQLWLKQCGSRLFPDTPSSSGYATISASPPECQKATLLLFPCACPFNLSSSVRWNPVFNRVGKMDLVTFACRSAVEF